MVVICYTVLGDQEPMTGAIYLKASDRLCKLYLKTFVQFAFSAASQQPQFFSNQTQSCLLSDLSLAGISVERLDTHRLSGLQFTKTKHTSNIHKIHGRRTYRTFAEVSIMSHVKNYRTTPLMFRPRQPPLIPLPTFGLTQIMTDPQPLLTRPKLDSAQVRM